jgi:alkylation response protein AidB-like acyl-CoA dehydrogenase
MDFSWSPEQNELFENVLCFARENLSTGIVERDRTRTFGEQEWKACAAFGLSGLSIPREFGGMGLDCLSTARAIEAFGKGCPDGGLGFSLCAHLLACAVPIARCGSPEQKAKYLPRLCSGEWIGANAITESEAGSDAFALKASARIEGDEFVLSGEKSFVTNGPIAQLFLVYASTRPERGFMGVSAFLVERETDGLVVGKPIETTGLTTAPLSSLYLDDCRVAATQRLGGEGMGGAIFKDSMGWERSCLFAFWLGAMDRQLEQTIEQANTRRQFGRAIASNQAVSHKIADMKLRLEAARLLVYRACWERAQGRPSELHTSLAKLAVSEAFIQSSLDAVQIFGGSGVIQEIGIERYLRDALPGTVYSGTSEMQRELIARALGLSARGRN